MKNWFLYDSIYRTNPFRAVCFEVCDSLKEAEENAPYYGDDTVIVEYDIVEGHMANPKVVN